MVQKISSICGDDIPTWYQIAKAVALFATHKWIEDLLGKISNLTDVRSTKNTIK